MAKTKKPKGLSISRDGFKFTCTWKIADSDYGNGQEFEYRTKGATGWRKWKSKDCGKATTSKSVTLSASSFYPTSGVGDKLLAFEFRVRGNRKSYKKDGKTINPGWSDWETKTFDITAPPKPTLSAELDSGYTNKTTFSWAIPTLSAKQIFSNVQWQTALVQDCNYTDGSKATYGSLTTGSSTGSSTQTEDSSTLANGHSYTRWFRVKARGPAGDSEWTYTKHVYAKTNQTTNISINTSTTSGGIEVTTGWNSSGTNARPIDSIVIQKVITTPDAGLTCPSGASWTDVATIAPKDGSDAFKYVEGTTIAADQCLFVRANTVHDGQSTPGEAKLASVGALTAPTGLSVNTDDTTFRAQVSVTNNSSVPDAHIAVVFQGSTIKPYIAGIIPHGSSDALVIQCPDWSDEDAINFEVYAFVGSYRKQTRSDNADCYSIEPLSGKPLMTSSKLSDGGSVPKAPTGLTLTETDVTGTIRAKWNWTWTDADGTELSWADHVDAWESTSEPSKYIITNLHSAAWNISGLETGKRWYVRARFYKGTDDNQTFGPYSDIAEIDLAVAPLTPALQFSSPVIAADGKTTAYWSFVSGDGTDQVYAEICTATIASGVITRGSVIAHVETAYSLVLDAAKLGWTSGNTYNLCVRVFSASGKQSEWSAPVPIVVAPPVTCTISSTSLETVTVPDDQDDESTRSVLSLTELPLTVTVTGASYDKTTTLAVERAADYYTERPDESDFEGYEGETIALVTQTGADAIVITRDDLYGSFDDGAQYRIVAMVKDGYGQTASAELEFEVHWDHQAVIPEADVQTLEDSQAVVITPREPSGAISTDRVDIYRLSADKPVLLYSDAEFDTPYVDPYPALGSAGGHRIVLKTAEGDYITEDNQFAWIDLGADEGDALNLDLVIIDFGDDKVILKNNMELSSSWEKDFQQTQYLGGSIQGDWNPGVSRSSTVQAVAVVNEESDAIEALRRLSVYTGICNVRTPDGSSFCADVQVSEDRSYNTAGKVATFKLAVSRVDPELYGIKYGDWIVGAAGLLDENGNRIVDENGAWIMGMI